MNEPEVAVVPDAKRRVGMTLFFRSNMVAIIAMVLPLIIGAVAWWGAGLVRNAQAAQTWSQVQDHEGRLRHVEADDAETHGDIRVLKTNVGVLVQGQSDAKADRDRVESKIDSLLQRKQ